MMHDARTLKERINELEGLLEISERKSDILTNLLKEANAEFERALELLTRTEAKFRAVFENAPEAVCIIDTDSRQILDCNPFFGQWLGYSREELLSMVLDELVSAEPQELQTNILTALERGLVRIQERRYIKKDGTIVDAEVTGTVVEHEGKKCLAILIRDVTERNQLEAFSRYKELFESVGDPVFINDSQGRFLEVNAGACRLFDYSREQVLAMRLKEFVKAEQRHILAETGKRLQSGESVQFEMDLITKNGEFFPFEFHARPISFMGRSAVLSVARDLSVRKRLEQTLIRTERLTAVGEMASGVAHNFNNLLQMIMGSAQAAMVKLEQGKIAQGGEAVRAILHSCERGADVVRRIKDFTHMNSNGADEVRSFDLNELIREAMELTRPLWKDLPGSRKFELKALDDKAHFVRGKPSEVYEVIVNLIKNGLEAMPQGGTLTICTRTYKEKVFLKISDTGVGIPAENLRRIFEPFFTTKGLRSSGLGLSSSYGIIKKHQGDVQVESTPGVGTTFTVILPRAKEEQKKASDEKDPYHLGHKIRFLVIDDETNIVKAMKMYFEDSEVEIVAALSGREGLDEFCKGGFDVVLCDLGMDDMNGWEVGESIKRYCESHNMPKPPFLIYTGWDKKIDPQHLPDRGIDRIVTKPIPYDALLRIAQEEIAKRPAAFGEKDTGRAAS
jgi:PAS domain S-box-containing protein